MVYTVVTEAMIGLIFTAALLVMKGQGCLRSNNKNGLPPFHDYSGPGFNTVINTDVIPQAHQAIIPSYRFDCCGNIIEWGVDVFSNSDDEKFRYFLDLQVWRPLMNVQESGCYSRIGSNSFTSMSQDNRLAIVTPPPQERVQIQPGDVLGFYVESSGRDTKGVTLLEDFNTTGDRGYQTEEVWYTDLQQLVIANRNCPFPVGSTGQLSMFARAAPVISVSINTMECSHPVISSTPIAATPSISLLTTPTNTSAATTSTGSIKILIGAAIAAVILVAIIVSSTAIFGAAVCVKARRHCSNEELHVAKNEAYGDKVQGVTAYRESVFYDYPTTQHNKQKKNSNLHHDFTSLRSTE